MVDLQVYQTKLLQGMDESSLELAAFKELHSVTDLALGNTKTTAQVIGRSMAFLVVLECQLWLMEIKDVDICPLPGLPGLPH